MKSSHISAVGYVLPLLPVMLLGALAATGSGKAMLAAARSGHPTVLKTDAALVGLPFGPYRVSVVEDVVLHDGRRGKDVPVTAVVPRTGGPFPVIVLSHAAGGDGDQNRPLTSYWASHGYVVLCPTHADSLAWQRRQAEAGIISTEAAGEPAVASDGNAADGFFGGNDREALRNPQCWMDRAQDISCVIDSLEDLGRRVPALAGRMDPNHVGVGGTSWLGATTAQIVGGATFGVSSQGRMTSLRDARARAVLVLTTHGSAYLGLPPSCWETVRAPMLAITASCHSVRGDDTRFPLREGQYLVQIAGPHPLSFGGDYGALLSDGSGRQQLGFFPCVEDTTLAFWDSTLKGDIAAKTRLDEVPERAAQAFGVSASAPRSGAAFAPTPPPGREAAL